MSTCASFAGRSSSQRLCKPISACPTSAKLSSQSSPDRIRPTVMRTKTSLETKRVLSSCFLSFVASGEANALGTGPSKPRRRSSATNRSRRLGSPELPLLVLSACAVASKSAVPPLKRKAHSIAFHWPPCASMRSALLAASCTGRDCGVPFGEGSPSLHAVFAMLAGSGNSTLANVRSTGIHSCRSGSLPKSVGRTPCAEEKMRAKSSHAMEMSFRWAKAFSVSFPFSS
mmetsp:Transcript_140235/g.247859  ORF Transcript_140235/g.247859 Transcript_140235/m.247859 type:complete len:229 (+) Transcript_140235:298-984(+)